VVPAAGAYRPSVAHNASPCNDASYVRHFATFTGSVCSGNPRDPRELVVWATNSPGIPHRRRWTIRWDWRAFISEEMTAERARGSHSAHSVVWASLLERDSPMMDTELGTAAGGSPWPTGARSCRQGPSRESEPNPGCGSITRIVTMPERGNQNADQRYRPGRLIDYAFEQPKRD
jgi:hypothetical protein